MNLFLIMFHETLLSTQLDPMREWRVESEEENGYACMFVGGEGVF